MKTLLLSTLFAGGLILLSADRAEAQFIKDLQRKVKNTTKDLKEANNLLKEKDKAKAEAKKLKQGITKETGKISGRGKTDSLATLAVLLKENEKLIYYNDFNFPDNFWGNYDNRSNTRRVATEVDDGLYNIVNESTRTLWYVKDMNIDLRKNFSIEASIAFNGGNDQSSYGINFGQRSNFYPFNSYGINSSGSYALFTASGSRPEQVQNFIDFTRSDKLKTKKGEFNKLSIEKNGNTISLYINEEKVSDDEMLSARPMMYYGSCVGFYVGQGMDISVDYFIAKYLDDNAGVASGGSKSDNTPPKIILTEPKLPNADKKISLTNSSVLVTGNVKDDNSVYKLMVNDTEVPVDERGNFSTFLPLEEGDNNFTIIATDGFMNDARNVFTVTRKPGVSRGNAPLKTGTKASAETPGKYYALFIGVQNYKDPQINQLDRPVEDAGSLAEVLTSNYSFDPKNIMLLKNPNRIDLFKAFDSLQKKVTRNDNLLIFYAGHGLWIENMKQGYWLPADAGKTDKSTWMSNADIKNYITSISSKHTLLITDACFSGGIFKTRAVLPDADKAMNEYIKTPSRKAITSGTLTEVPDNSVFIEYLVKSLKTNSEKYITALELFNRFNRNVINNSPSASQIPQYGVISEAGDEGGEFIFIKNKQ